MARRPTRSNSDLRVIATYQKVLIGCLLGQLFLWVGYIVVTIMGMDSGDMGGMRLVGMFTVVLGLIGGIFVLLMGMKVSGPALGIFLGVLTLVPLIGLIMILIANTQATSLLQLNGVRVGLFGARKLDLDKRAEEMDNSDDDDDEEERPRRRRRRRAADINEDEGW